MCFIDCTYLLSPSLEKKTVKVWMFPFASAGGRQLRRTNRLETNTGTTSLGAEGRILELGIAEEKGEEIVRGMSATAELDLFTTIAMIGSHRP